MRSRNLATGVSAVIALAATIAEASHGHKAAHEALRALHRRHRHARELEATSNETIEKRDGGCAFPADAGLVAVTPNLGNGGWAFAPDKKCVDGYCPYACPPGQVSMQWDPNARTYSYPESMHGGLLCQNGVLSKPFPDRPYCQSTATNIGVQNNCAEPVAFCQTVLPGDEDMLIPTLVSDHAVLAVPDPSYWASTAAHYYINAPGVSATDGCVWGSVDKPIGNWSPYVAGANADASGQTFIKLGWNPVYLESATPFRNEMPNFGVRIECPNGGCNGLPCAIDPTQNIVNQMLGSITDGAGGGAFCVVTVPPGTQANFVVFKPGEENKNKAGQFYQSTTQTTTATANSTTTTTTTTKSTTTATTPTSVHNSSTGSKNSTTSTSKQTGQPYYQLFDSSSPAQTTTAQPVQSTPSSTSKTNNGVASLHLSASLCLLALGAFLV